MDAKTLAALLNGREIGNEITKEEAKAAKEAGLVVVFGASDDLMELRGAVYGERGWDTAFFTKEGLLENRCDDDECPYFEELQNAATPLEPKWHDYGAPCWTYETAIPHETFEIFEDGELYCRGIVFALADVGKRGTGRYRRKPVTLDAFRWTGGPDQTQDPEWAVEAIDKGTIRFESDPPDHTIYMVIATPEGDHKAMPGDWIIRGVKGEIYPCKPDIFALIYEEE